MVSGTHAAAIANIPGNAQFTNKYFLQRGRQVRQPSRLKELIIFPTFSQASPCTGNLLAVAMPGERLLAGIISSFADDYLKGIQETLNEWSSPKDEEA